jgi:cardiolipin synthase
VSGDAPGTQGDRGSDRILTIPNLLSLVRILAIPAFVALIVDRDTTFTGLIVFAVVVATDWIDGAVARATGQVSELGKVLDPVADRLAVAAGLIALAVRGAFPWWATALILARDVVLLIVGLWLLAARRVRIEVRYVGKVGTFTTVVAIGCVAWGTLGYALEHAFLAVGWIAFAVAIVEAYVAAAFYAGDVRRTLAAPP